MGTPDVFSILTVIVLFAMTQGLWSLKQLLKRYVRG